MYERVGFFAAPLEVPRRTKLYFETDQSQKPELCHPGRQDPRFQLRRGNRCVFGNRRNMELRRNFRQTPARGSRLWSQFPFVIRTGPWLEIKSDVEPSRNVFVCAIVPTCIEILDGWISSARGATSDLPALEGGAKMSGGLQIQPDDELKFRRAFAAPACASPALPPRPFRSKKHAMLTPFPLPISIPPSTPQSSSRSRSPRRSGCTTVATRKSLLR